MNPQQNNPELGAGWQGDPLECFWASTNLLASQLQQLSCCSAGRIEISSQNHNYAVDPATLPEEVEVPHINLNDGTCAGMVFAGKGAMAFPYHPAASPGPHDSDICFEQFMDMIRKEKKGDTSFTPVEEAAEHLGKSF